MARPLFVGQRDLSDGNTAVFTRTRGSVSRENLQSIRRPADPQGGIGTLYVDLTLNRSVSGPQEDFRWHQDVLRPWLEKRFEDNKRAEETLLTMRNAMKDVLQHPADPQEAASLTAPTGKGWFPYLAGQILKAKKSGKKDQQILWSLEWGAAMDAQRDLHRWTELLLGNQLFALSLQAQTAPLFRQVDAMYREKLPYKANSHIGRFPAGEMTLYNADNYLELERRAEAVFQMPADWPKLAKSHPQARTLPPNLRADFARILSGLDGANQECLASAIHTPYELSFLAAALHKAAAGDRVDMLLTVLRRYATLHPEPRLQDMMEVIHDRAGGWFCGLEWGDRYQAPLMQVPDDWPSDPMDAIWRAHAWVRKQTRDTEGFVFTLREALETGALDCIRTTDAMGALYRNSGHPGFHMIRLSRGGSGHTIAALRDKNGDVHYLDGQVGNGAPGRWPEGFRKPLKPHPAYAVELFGRGLDSWVFLEGYLVFGPARGNHVSAPVPYLDGYDTARSGLLGEF